MKRNLRWTTIALATVVLLGACWMLVFRPGVDYSSGVVYPSLKKIDDNPPMDLLAKGAFDELEALFDYLADHNERLPRGWTPLEYAYGNFDINERDTEDYDKWIAAYPESHVARTARGSALIQWAWDARGTGAGCTVTDEGSRLFQERLSLAADDFTRAMRLEPGDPNAACAMITVCKGQGTPRDTAQAYYNKGVALDPGHLDTRQRMLEFLKPRWGGTRQAMFEFAREASANAPEDSDLDRILLEAHDDNGIDAFGQRDDAYYAQPGVWAEIQPVCERRLAHDPDSPYVLNRTAYYAFHARQYAVAAKLFDRIGARWKALQWQSSRGYLDACIRANAEAGTGKDARAWLKKEAGRAAKTRPDYAGHRYLLAILAADAGKKEEAVANIEKIYADDKESGLGYAPEVCRLLAEAGKHELATEIYEAYFEIKQEDALAYFHAGNSLLELDRYEEALNCFLQITEMDPTWSSAVKNVAYTYYRMGEYEKAIEWYNRTLILINRERVYQVPGHAAPTFFRICMLYRGRSYEKLGQDRMALQDYETYSKAEGGNNGTIMIALVKLKCNSEDPDIRDPEEALAMVEAAIEHPSGYLANYVEALAIAYAANDMTDKSLAAWERYLGFSVLDDEDKAKAREHIDALRNASQ